MNMFGIKPVRSILWILSAALLINFSRVYAGEEQEYKTVVAEGVSALVPGKQIDRAYDEALLDAKRNAVHTGLGVLVNSETIVENYQLLSDRILTKSAGYVRKFKVISRNSEGDLYRVVISAQVALADLHSDLLAVQILKEEKGYPKLMLIGVEKAGDDPKNSVSAQTVIEEILIERGFDLVDESQVELIKARDVALNPDDLDAAAALGQRFGAQIIVVFQAIADYEGSSNAYGLSLNSYRGNLDARIIYTDTADLLGSVNSFDYASAEGKPVAIRLAFQRAARKVAPLIIEKILQDWQKHTNKLELIVKGLTYRDMKKMKDEIQMIRGVIAIGTPELRKGVAIFQIQGDLTAERLADKLMDGVFGAGLKINSLSGGRIEAEYGTLED
ncbi:hypothetical protein JW926_02350 [Candidatus Sumerlaeota bacterium]|nr:hypothetical protein [Candidatus Sumerlaeota bacterium]